jgi:hypothetical protein
VLQWSGGGLARWGVGKGGGSARDLGFTSPKLLLSRVSHSSGVAGVVRNSLHLVSVTQEDQSQHT